MKPTASSISVSETLALLDGSFREVAEGVARGEYALWLGSGISRERVADLKVVVRRVLNYLSDGARGEETPGPYSRALGQALGHALTAGETAAIDTSLSPGEWPNIDNIVERLVGEYALLLDIRVIGHEKDHLLWDVVDVCGTYANDNLEPDCEHIAIAVLALEGVFPKIASANWDGLVEKAVDRLTGGNKTLLAILVRPEEIQGAAGRSHLHKFHGCAVRARESQGLYREFLVGRDEQITNWPNDAKFALMRSSLEVMSVSFRTLMIGLSAQDSNIKDIFSVGRAMLKRPWPAHPPAYVFAGDELGAEQGTMLKSVYEDAYDEHQLQIEQDAKIPAYGKPLLTALLLSVLGQKLATLLGLVEAPNLSNAARQDLTTGMLRIRDLTASKAGHTSDERRAFMNGLIGGLSRNMAIFRGDRDGLAKSKYSPVGAFPVGQIANDPTLPTSGMAELAAFIGGVGLGMETDGWSISQSVNDPQGGTFLVTTAASALPQKVFAVANYEALSKLISDGILDETDPNVVVALCTAPVSRRATSSSTSFGRDSSDAGCREFSFRTLVSNADSPQQLLSRLKEEAIL